MDPQDQAPIVVLHGKIDRLNDNIDAVKEKQEEISEHIAKIKEAVYNPDSGLYARLRSLEQWRDSTEKVNWFISTTVAALAMQTIWDIFLT
jgi:peptidoglycan hydrolase CwlO-like protein